MKTRKRVDYKQNNGNTQEVYSVDNKPTPADIGAVNKAGDTMTGTLDAPSLQVSGEEVFSPSNVPMSSQTAFGMVKVYTSTQGGKTILHIDTE